MSTIITQNPYTFTVEDNMSIKAVFENAGVIVQDIRQAGSFAGYSSESYYLRYGSTLLATWYIGTSGSTITKNGTYPRTLTDTSKSINITLASGSGVFNGKFKIVEVDTGTVLVSKTTSTTINSLLGKKVYITFDV